ncbi:DUF1707 SHOCT-like domain-containing protein [Amycolatopsis tucumanensis]|uniref:DUF1707 domain-containing protein n=1 Tax=Amycolatopsis tucumanensis TaxID=401106 RepID=A0ABP7JHR0_9PSEU|nr:DUF1707 domain-containing protein [Amycolatopsis tucumanensis]MCF6425237.1 DUF1707 domain-containing protein [Amycolatopsis tucumanensis]
MSDSTIRASDADRERVVTALQQHVGEGRLTLDEFSERSAAAYRSRTRGELDVLTRDLPTPAPRASTTRRPLVPVLVVVAVLLLGALLAMGYPATADAMGEMMSQMGRMCG